MSAVCLNCLQAIAIMYRWFLLFLMKSYIIKWFCRMRWKADCCRLSRSMRLYSSSRDITLPPKKKILLYGPSGCGKTMSAERLAWSLNLPLLKVRFDAVLSSYFGESASNLRAVFDYCKSTPVVLLLDECDFIAKSRTGAQDVGEVPRIVNMLLTLLDEYDAPGLVIATTNLQGTLDKALFRRFDDVIEMSLPGQNERQRLLTMTMADIPLSKELKLADIAKQMTDFSASNVVMTARRAAKISILSGKNEVGCEHFAQALQEQAQMQWL